MEATQINGRDLAVEWAAEIGAPIPEAQSAPPGPQNPAVALGFDRDTIEFYQRLAEADGLNSIVACPGRGKTMLLLNIAFMAAVLGKSVQIISLEMTKRRLVQRLSKIASGPSDAGDPAVKQVINAAFRHMRLDDQSAVRTRGDALLANLGASDGADLVLIDASEFAETNGFREGEALLQSVERQAGFAGKGVWLTAQLNKGAERVEIPDNASVYMSPAKTQAASVVVSIADSGTQGLKTVCITKDRFGRWTDQQVFRLALDPKSLRLAPLPASPAPSRTGWQPESRFVNCHANDFPDFVDYPGDDSDDHDDHWENPDPRKRTVPAAGHAPHGWVPVDRDLFFRSIYFENQEFKNVYRLLDLAQLAEFRDRETRMPGSQRRVSLARGQYATALRFLAKRWGISASTANKFLQDASDEGILDVDSRRDGTIITVKYYGAMGGPQE